MTGEPLKLRAVGDIFLGDTTLNIGRGVRSSLTRNGMAELTSAVAPFFLGSDLGFGNLECVLSNHGLRKWRIDSVEMRGRPEFARALRESGIGLVNIANNHIFQHGREPFEETVRVLQEQGVLVVGREIPGGAAQPVVVEKKGIRLGWLGYSLHYEQYRPGERCPYALRDGGAELVREIRKIRQSFNGHLVCSLHWGHEFVDRPSEAQRRLARQLIDAGVLLVLGHHPHVLQGIERYGNGLIAYSLGNFVFDVHRRELRETVVLAVDIDRAGIVDWETIPAVIDGKFCPQPAPADARRRIADRLHELGSLLAGPLSTDPELAVLSRQLYRAHRRESIRRFLAGIHRYHPLYSSQIVSRFILRKIGLVHDP